MSSHQPARSLLQQKKLQWAREREEMVGLCGIWGTLDKQASHPRRSSTSSLLPPISYKQEDGRADESETSGYTSDSPQREKYTSDSSQSTSTAEERLRWGDRGVGVGHLWEPELDLPDCRLPQTLESYRTTPRWVERRLGHQADILYIQHSDDSQSRFLLGQNAPLLPEVLQEREKRRQKAMEHQKAIRKQLEERERRRKEEKETRLREEILEEERLLREQERQRQLREDELRKLREKEDAEKKKEQIMKQAIEAAELKACEVRKKFKTKEFEKTNRLIELPDQYKAKLEVGKKTTVEDNIMVGRVEKSSSRHPEIPREVVECGVQSECTTVVAKSTTDCGSQANEHGVNDAANSSLALVLDGQLLLLPQTTTAMQLLTDIGTQTVPLCATSAMFASSSRRHARCSSPNVHSRSLSRPTRFSLNERPQWGINRPTVQYLKQSEKDPHYMRRIRRRARRTKEALLPSERRMLPCNTDEEQATEKRGRVEDILNFGFRMVSNSSSPTFVPIGSPRESQQYFNLITHSGKHITEEQESTGCCDSTYNITKCKEVKNDLNDSESSLLAAGNVSHDVLYPDTPENVYDELSFGELAEDSSNISPEETSTTREDSSLYVSTSASGEDSCGVYDKIRHGLDSSFSLQSSIPTSLHDTCAVASGGDIRIPAVQSPSSPRTHSSDLKTNCNAQEYIVGEEGIENVDENDDDDDLVIHRTMWRITALKLGLERLKMEMDTRCSSPISVFSFPGDLE